MRPTSVRRRFYLCELRETRVGLRVLVRTRAALGHEPLDASWGTYEAYHGTLPARIVARDVVECETKQQAAEVCFGDRFAPSKVKLLSHR